MINEKELEVLFAAKKLSDAEKQILIFIANNLKQAIHLGAQGIAQHCYTSSATVVRLAKKLGYDGSREMLYEFERTANAPQGISGSKTDPYLRYKPGDLDAFFTALEKRGTIGVSGQGYSKLVADYLERKLMAFGCIVIQQADLEPETVLANFRDKLDAFLFISKSGETEIVVQTAELCRSFGIPTIAFTGNRMSSIASLADALFVITDDHPFDIENVEPNFFFGYNILAIEEMLNIYQHRNSTKTGE